MKPALCVLLGACGRVGFEAVPAVDGAPTGSFCDRVGAVAYCNDFEGGELAGAVNVGGQADPGGGHEGTDGWLFVAAPGTGPLIRIPAPAGATSLYLGGRFRFEGTTAINDYVVLAQATSPDFEKLSYDATFENRIQLVSTINQVGIGDQAEAETLPRDRWFCWEFQIQLADTSGRFFALVDGVPVFDISDVDTQPMTGFNVLEVGAQSSPLNAEPVFVHLDNLVADVEPVGCP